MTYGERKFDTCLGQFILGDWRCVMQRPVTLTGEMLILFHQGM